ncbi:MAG: response regulator [Pseudomonadota bacterium]|nr:response regulator [Pseudomonadota bacterium]
MLQQQLASLDSEPVGGGLRWLVPALVALVAASGAALFFIMDEGAFAGLFVAGGVAMLVAAFAIERRMARPAEINTLIVPDHALVSGALDLVPDPVALTRGDGELVTINQAFSNRFGEVDHIDAVSGDSDLSAQLSALLKSAWRDGNARAEALAFSGGGLDVSVTRAGSKSDLLQWHFSSGARPDLLTIAAKRIAGTTGERLAAAGVMAALIDGDGTLLAANKPFADRAIGAADPVDADLRFTDLVRTVDNGLLHFITEGESTSPLRAVHFPLNPASEDGAGTVLILDQHDSNSLATSSNVQALLEMLPIGLALVDRDGRFLTMNKAFHVAAGINAVDTPTYPGDLVAKEDKASVADAVRRNARGPAMSGDLPIRLKRHSGEPVALTVAGLRGLGDAAVLLLLKDNSEEAKLKRQVAQATKMQAVGQLAGGVAHDFNNILPAIMGHCDLMMMRHTPGDSDYDDIQQIKSNSNRAAGLTRQLLAFSRQQTLRPQILQLPDVVSEVSHLLKRLLGETVQLVVKHGRDLGSVRADPGQLEQVIVNLSVNARDAMVANGGGALTIHTYPVRADQVADLGSDILPIADYAALSISDTGTGIAPNVLGKVFEPFFTTKEVGKGTGLGLSTVYGIVKQSGGFIFADSTVGEGTRFVIYLPVNSVEVEERPRRLDKIKPQHNELWGTGTILLVEDEAMVRTVAERALARHGYKVITANNGEEALERLEESGAEVALLISDVVMPVMDGPTMVREARKSHPDLPILFMSGYAEEQLRKSIDIANVAFLPKPFSVLELAEAVQRVLLGTK